MLREGLGLGLGLGCGGGGLGPLGGVGETSVFDKHHFFFFCFLEKFYMINARGKNAPKKSIGRHNTKEKKKDNKAPELE